MRSFGALVVIELLDVDVEALGPQVVLVVEAVLLALLGGMSAATELLAQLEDALLALGGVGLDDLVDAALELGQVGLAGLVVDLCDNRRREVQDLLELLLEPCRAGSRSATGRP